MSFAVKVCVKGKGSGVGEGVSNLVWRGLRGID